MINSKEAYLLSSLDGKYAGQTALIAGAGPSLADNISYIQANRNKLIILAVNKAVKFLLQNGITPDFVVALDARNMNATLGGLENQLGRANCIFDIRTDKGIYQVYCIEHYKNSEYRNEICHNKLPLMPALIRLCFHS